MISNRSITEAPDKNDSPSTLNAQHVAIDAYNVPFRPICFDISLHQRRQQLRDALSSVHLTNSSTPASSGNRPGTAPPAEAATPVSSGSLLGMGGQFASCNFDLPGETELHEFLKMRFTEVLHAASHVISRLIYSQTNTLLGLVFCFVRNGQARPLGRSPLRVRRRKWCRRHRRIYQYGKKVDLKRQDPWEGHQKNLAWHLRGFP